MEAILERVRGKSSSRCHILCLQTLRLFSREKDKLAGMTSDLAINQMMRLAGLQYYAQQDSSDDAGVLIQNADPEGK